MNPFFENMDITICRNKIETKSSAGVRTKSLDITLEEIRHQIAMIGDQKPYTRDTQNTYYSRQLENASLPFINFIFYYLFVKNIAVPTLPEIVDTYISIYCDVNEDGTLRCKPSFGNPRYVFKKEPLVGRIYRASNSFYREIELLFQLMRYDDIDVKYNFQKDLQGIDLIVTCNGKEFYLASYIDTSKSNNWKDVKDNTRHVNGQELINIVANIDNDSPAFNTVNYNGVYTYSPKFVAGKYVEILKKAGI